MFDAASRSSAARRAAGVTRTIRPAQLAAAVGDGHRQLLPDPAQETPLMAGRFSLSRLRDGLYLHCTDIEHLRDMHTRFATHEGGLKVMLKLEGNAEVSFGGMPVALDAGSGPHATPRGAVLALAAPEDFERRARAGTRERMVVLTLAPQWLEASGLAAAGRRRHLDLAHWQPSARAVAIAEQLVGAESLSGQLLSLYQESRALELIGEALAGTGGGEAQRPAELRPAEFARILRLRKHLQDVDFDRCTMDDIAQELASNATTLQQHFRRAFGTTIFDYLREARLQRAAEALQRRGVSVAQAAEIAGYGSQANFSTAFRRRFGLTPKQMRIPL
jgi:AraC-like DNA-binding protein